MLLSCQIIGSPLHLIHFKYGFLQIHHKFVAVMLRVDVQSHQNFTVRLATNLNSIRVRWSVTLMLHWGMLSLCKYVQLIFARSLLGHHQEIIEEEEIPLIGSGFFARIDVDHFKESAHTNEPPMLGLAQAAYWFSLVIHDAI